MKKILLFIVPVLSLVIAYRINQEFLAYSQASERLEVYTNKLKHLELLTQSYLISRIEALQLISPVASQEVKEVSLQNKENTALALAKAEQYLKMTIREEYEKQLFDVMMEKLEDMKKIINAATTANAKESIQGMFEGRKPFRRTSETYAFYIGSKREKAFQDQTVSQLEMKKWINWFLGLQVAGLLIVIYYVRPIRSKV